MKIWSAFYNKFEYILKKNTYYAHDEKIALEIYLHSAKISNKGERKCNGVDDANTRSQLFRN